MDRRLKAGHPWVYRGEIADLQGRWTAGDDVEVLDAAGHFLGRGFYNPRPSLALRLLARTDEPIDEAFFHRRLTAALDYRRAAGLASDAYRLCWSESDGLPGLVVDRYGPVSVIQCLTLGMTRAESRVTASIEALFPGGAVYRQDDTTAARIEGFQAEHGWRGDAGPSDLIITEGDCRLSVVIGAGQKTGLYLDQRENHRRVAALAA